ncbi:MAG: hypothetical protein ABJI60_14705 [Kangiellaceae bacterium]
MKFVFKSIPKASMVCYLLGFLAIALALVNYWSDNPLMSDVLMLQIFLAGAIVVAIGSVINTLYQFKRPKDK